MWAITRRFWIAIGSWLLVGCAVQMPLTQPGSEVSLEDSGVAVFSISMINNHTDFDLWPEKVAIEGTARNGVKVSEDFLFSSLGRSCIERKCDFHGSIRLPSGDYVFADLKGRTNLDFSFILPVWGRFDTPVNKRFSMKSGELTYLGHLTARLLEKTSPDQEYAGPTMPFIDQYATGMSDGTFEFTIEDYFEPYTSSIKQQFRFSSDVVTTKSLLE